MSKKIKLRKELKDNLYIKWNQGRSLPRHDIKDKYNWTPFIHSYTTYKTYVQQVDKFVNYCYDNGYRHKDDNIILMVQSYIESLKSENKSAWTVRTAASAIAKALDIRTEDLNIKLPTRHRADIKRSREAVERDRHINPEHYKLLYTFERCFGLRKDKELSQIEAKDFVFDNNDIYVTVKGKGGKIRTVKAYGSTQEINLIKRHIILNQTGKLFHKIPSGFDAHSLRGEYAARVYHAHARNLKQLSSNEIYYCRGNKAGEHFDKKALAIVSRMLGHNRLDVVVNNYSYKF